MIYFDNAATTLIKPKNVYTEVQNAIKNYANPGRSGYSASLSAAQKVFSARLAVADLFGSISPERVVFTLNATMSLNMAVKCFHRANSKILISDMEHNSVLRPVNKLFESEKIKRFDIFKVDLDNNDNTVQNAISLIDNDVSMIVVTHVSNVCGKILPIQRIFREAKAKNPNIITVLDAAQSAGTIEINMESDMIDILCAPAHKGLLGIMGLGIMLLGDNVDIEKTETFIEGGTGINSLDRQMPEDSPERFEGGTLNVPAICALLASIEYIKKEKIFNIYNAEKKLYDRALNMLGDNSNIILYSKNTDKGFIGPILFNLKNKTSDFTANILASHNICVRSGYHCSPLAHESLGTIKYGGVRISMNFNNTESELDKFYRILKEI